MTNKNLNIKLNLNELGINKIFDDLLPINFAQIKHELNQLEDKSYKVKEYIDEQCAKDWSQDDTDPWGWQRGTNKMKDILCVIETYRMEIEEAEKEEKNPPEKTTDDHIVASTLTRPNQKLEATAVLEGLPTPIAKEAREVLFEQLNALNNFHPKKMEKVANSFRKKFGIKDTKIVHHITTAEHGEFLSLAISKIDESL